MIVGRCGTLVDWQGEGEERAYATLYRAEDILNWRSERVNGRNVLTLVVLRESLPGVLEDGSTWMTVEQMRVLRLEEVQGPTSKVQSEAIRRRTVAGRRELDETRQGRVAVHQITRATATGRRTTRSCWTMAAAAVCVVARR